MVIIVGVADMKASADPKNVLVTHALGSCLGITVYDPALRVGAMLHAMLPDSSIDRVKAAQNPFMFIDSGVPRLFHECYRLGAVKKRLIVKVAGGATSKANLEDDYFQIGRRNFVTLRQLFWRNNMLIKSYDVGGCSSRTMSLDIGSGSVQLKIEGVAREL